MTAMFQRVWVHVVRVGPSTAHVSVPSFADGQILVPVPTFDLMSATGMTRAQLTGVDLVAMVNVAAATDADVHPHGWKVSGEGERPWLWLPHPRRQAGRGTSRP
ncbi:hypothetical protein [Streptomyces sp. NPDC006384]|uniref:hypothetical protein n=1 Tax=Streptomyces sp. NPDC006384 TaxID=3364745 RepID=UPI0036A75FEC